MAPTERSREQRVTFWWRRFLLLTYPVVTASAAQLCLITQDEIRERKLREAQEIRERLRAATRESKQMVGKKDHRNKKPPQTLTPATVERELEPSKRPPTGGWPMRVSDCPHPTESRALRENAFPGVVVVSVMRSPLEPDDGSGRHPNEKRTANGTVAMSWIWEDDATVTNDKQDGDVFRIQSVPSVEKGGARTLTTGSPASPSVPSCSAAQPSESQAVQTDVESVSSEESFSIWNVPTASQPEQEFLLEQLQSLLSSGITGQKALRAIVQMFPDQQYKITLSNAVKTLQATMQKR